MNTIIFFLMATVSQAAGEETAIYNLRGLAPVGFTHSETASAARYYFEFENEQGKHVFVYEEGANERPPRMLGTLRQAASGGMLCAADVECSEKAQCASDCHEMYYALAPSAAAAPGSPGLCRIKSSREISWSNTAANCCAALSSGPHSMRSAAA